MKDNVKSIIKTGAILLAIGFICTLLLSLCNALTKDKIAALAVEAEQSAMTETLPDAKKFAEVNYENNGIVTAVYEGKSADDSAVGYCVKAEPNGYGGAISMMVGVDKDGAVRGVKIISMSETPGLGARASEPGFTESYKGKSGEVKVKKSGIPTDNEIAAISGATITSKAVTEGVNAALSAVENLR